MYEYSVREKKTRQGSRDGNSPSLCLFPILGVTFRNFSILGMGTIYVGT